MTFCNQHMMASSYICAQHTIGTTSTVCDGMFCIDPMTGRIYLSGELVSIWQ